MRARTRAAMACLALLPTLAACTGPAAEESHTTTAVTAGVSASSDTPGSAGSAGSQNSADPSDAAGTSASPSTGPAPSPPSSSSAPGPGPRANEDDPDSPWSAAFATGTQAAGLTLGNGKPITLDVFAISQVKLSETSLDSIVDGPGLKIPNDGQLALVGHSDGKAFGFLVPVEYVEGDVDAEQTAPPIRVGYADESGWHNGPTTQRNPYSANSLATVSGSTLYWVDPHFDEETYETSWTLNAWTAGESKTKTLITRKQSDFADPPSTIVVHRGRVYFGGTSWGGTAPALWSIPVNGGPARAEAGNAGAPFVFGDSIAFAQFGDAPDPLNGEFASNANMTSVKVLVPGKKPATLLKVAPAEVAKGINIAREQFDNNDGMYDQDAMGVPLSVPALVGAGPDTLLLRQRGQVLVINTTTGQGARFLPAPRSAEFDSSYNPSGVACASGVAISQSSEQYTSTDMLWYSPERGLTRLPGGAGGSLTKCSGGGVELLADSNAVAGYASALRFTPPQ